FQPRTLAKQETFWPVPVMATLFNPPLQRGSGNFVHPTASDDFKNRRLRRGREVTLRMSFCMGNVEVGGVEGAAGQNIQAISPSFSIRHGHSTPPVCHG